MAILLNGTTDRLERTSGILGANNWSVSLWAFWNSLENLYDPIAFMVDNGGSYIYCGRDETGGTDGSDNPFVFETDLGRTQGTTPIFLKRWYHIGIIRNGTSNRVYINTKLDISNANNPSFTPTINAVGCNGFGNNGNVAARNLKAWNAVLTEAEIIREAFSEAPIRKNNLFYDVRLRWPGDVKDLSGNGRHWTLSGGSVLEDPALVRKSVFLTGLENLLRISSAGGSTAAELVGVVSAALSMAADLTTAIEMSAGISAAGTIAANLTTAIQPEALVSAHGDASADLTTQIQMAAIGSAHGDASADLTTTIEMASLISTGATVSADLSVAVSLESSISAHGDLSANLTTAIEMAALISSGAVVTADLSTQIELAGLISTSAVVTAALAGRTRVEIKFAPADGWTVPQDQSTTGWPVNNQGVTKAGDNITASGNKCQILSGGPPGGSGYMHRFWIEPAPAQFANSGTLNFGFANLGLPDSLSEFWVRWYVRWESGLDLADTQKVLYLMPVAAGYFDVGDNHSALRFVADGSPYTVQGYGWRQLNGTSGPDPSNEQWHCMEVYVKVNSIGSPNSIIKWWINGTLRVDLSNVNMQAMPTGFSLPQNAILDNTDRDRWNDTADIVIDTTGPIGPLSAAAELVGVVSCGASASADLTTSIEMAAISSGSCGVVANLSTSIEMVAAASASGAIAADLSTSIELSAGILIHGDGAADLATAIELAAAIVGSAQSVADLQTAIEFEAIMSANGFLTADLLTEPVRLVTTEHGIIAYFRRDNHVDLVFQRNKEATASFQRINEKDGFF